MKKIFSILVLFVFVFTIISCGKSNNSEQTESSEHDHEETESSVTTLTKEQIKAVGISFGDFEQKELTATIKANGFLRVSNQNKANITTLYGGVVKSLKVDLGDRVQKGQIIATIANPEFIQLQEEYITVSSRIILAEQEKQRQTELSEGNAGAKKNLQTADSELKVLQARKASVQTQLQLMGVNINTVSSSNFKSELVIVSPINGTISNVFAKLGSYVDASSSIAELIDNSTLHLDLQVFEKDLPYIKIGQKITFNLTNNPTKNYEATVFNIGSSFENNSKSIAVHCKLTGNSEGLIDGMNITGMVSLDGVKSLAVPNDAIVNSEGKDFIFVVVDNHEEHNHNESDSHSHDESDDHNHKEKEDAHDHEGHNHDHGNHNHSEEEGVRFSRIEIIKGVSNMGYTAINPINEIPKGAKLVTKGAFFVNAKMNDTGEHSHSH